MQCKYSNNEKSPVFEKEDYEGHKKPVEISFEPVRKVKKIVAATNSTTWLFITRLRFIDESNH